MPSVSLLEIYKVYKTQLHFHSYIMEHEASNNGTEKLGRSTQGMNTK